MTKMRIIRALWRRASLLDRAATLLILFYLAAKVAEAFGWQPSSGLLSAVLGLLPLFFFVSAVFLLVRSRHWIATRVLWRLRNRLILAYIFVGLVPVILLLALGGILFYLGDVEVAAHLLHDDFHTKMEQVSAASDRALALARVIATQKTTLDALDRAEPVLAITKSAEQLLPGLSITFSPATPTMPVPTSATGPAELVERQGSLAIEAASVGQLPDGRWVKADARLPVTPQLLDHLSPELGPLFLGSGTLHVGTNGQATVGSRPRVTRLPTTRPGSAAKRQQVAIATRTRTLPPPANPFDIAIAGITTFDVVNIAHPGAKPKAEPPLFVAFSFRSSAMEKRIQNSLGEFQWDYLVVLIVVAGLFVVLFLLASIVGFVLARTITRTVAQLDEGTRHVKAGDFSHRISIQRRDQLGALAESFNSMTSSIESLLDEQRQRQRLENELTIAREVQSQLFPRSLPALPGLDLGAVCRAARVVSGDYYDCLQLDSHRVAVAIADISGKGISAALLMASLNSALRNLVVSDGFAGADPSEPGAPASGDPTHASRLQSTAALAASLNRYLLLNTSDDRYATFFFAVYDTVTRRLDYTNAGHLPPFFINGNRIEKLDRGGPVLGLLDGCVYEQATIQVEPGSLLVAYSDGITEPEDSYGEEFGPDRLAAEILRRRNQRPEQLCLDILEAVKTWCAPAEPFDDQTILVARMD